MSIEVVEEDIWNFHSKDHWIIVTTNGFVKTNGDCVMGRGIAKQAAVKFPDLPSKLGTAIRKYGNHVFSFPGYRIFSFPTKRVWWEKSSEDLITNSCLELGEAILAWTRRKESVYIVKPGCSNGGLKWKDVEPIVEKYLVNDFPKGKIVVCDLP